MSRALALVVVVLAAAAGFLLGRATRGDAGRAEGGEVEFGRAPRTRTMLPVDQAIDLQRRVARLEALEEENERLRERLRAVAPEGAGGAEAYADGTRLPDGRIVGGARWTESFVQMATGFFDSFFSAFIEEAQLTPEQERRIREGTRARITEAMQIMADHVNGDIDGDTAYERFGELLGDGRGMVQELLDDRQWDIYRKHEKTITSWMNDQIVAKEMANLRTELRLDPEQERRVRTIVESRYAQVGEPLQTGIPNVMLTAVRREQDRPIYERTAEEIRQLLRPDQRTAYESVEKRAETAPYEFRNMLVPR